MQNDVENLPIAAVAEEPIEENTNPPIIIARYQNRNEVNNLSIINKCKCIKILCVVDIFCNIVYTFYSTVYILNIFFIISGYYGAKNYKYSYLCVYTFFCGVSLILKIYALLHSKFNHVVYFHIMSSMCELVSMKLSKDVMSHIKKCSAEDLDNLRLLTQTIVITT